MLRVRKGDSRSARHDALAKQTSKPRAKQQQRHQQRHIIAASKYWNNEQLQKCCGEEPASLASMPHLPSAHGVRSSDHRSLTHALIGL